MTSAILSALSQADETINADINFFAIHNLNINHFSVKVVGMGQLTFPIKEKDIVKLLSVSSDAKFGLRDKTLLDKTVRDTYEISSDKLEIQCNPENMEKMLSSMRDNLGLSENSILTAHLHNMLIYTPGQFFKWHQDSEKLEGMIATLVVDLPSPHIGGDLIIKHHDDEYRFITENLHEKEIKCIAFYADCHHEVETVKEGYRVVLTYNLVLNALEKPAKKVVNSDLEKALDDYFYAPESRESPDLKMIYFFDHCYTEHSLRWGMLKGVDNKNAIAFFSAAKKLNLIPHLALVDIHESWTVPDEFEDKSDCDELIDGATSLSFWVDEDNKILPYAKYVVDEDECLWTKHTDEFPPDDYEYEGWMGNYGNTVDFWYRRAAVVLWRKSDEVRLQFRLNYDKAFTALLKLTQRQNQVLDVLDTIKKAGNLIYPLSNRPDKNKENYFNHFSTIAVYIQDKNAALTLLSNFLLDDFDVTIAESLVKLRNTYGVDWCLNLLKTCQTSKHTFWNKHQPQDSEKLVACFMSFSVDTSIIAFLLTSQIEKLSNDNEKYLARSNPVDRQRNLKNRMTQIKQLIFACKQLNNDFLSKKLAHYILSNPNFYPPLDLADIIVKLNEASEMIVQLLHESVTKYIEREYKKGLRAENDWSIEVKVPCKCSHCNTVEAFLKSTTESQKILAIIQHDRSHVTSILSGLALPIDITVEKKGSPHKLVITKTAALYQQAKKTFDKISTFYLKYQESCLRV